MQYHDPLRVRRGDMLRVGREDNEYPGWWWCTSIDAKQGWVPADLLGPTVKPGATLKILGDYESTELALQHGDMLEVQQHHGDWLLVRNADDQTGWVPIACVEPA